MIAVTYANTIISAEIVTAVYLILVFVSGLVEFIAMRIAWSKIKVVEQQTQAVK